MERIEYGPVYDDGTPIQTRVARVEDGRDIAFACAVVWFPIDGRAQVLKWAWHDRSARAWLQSWIKGDGPTGGGRYEVRPIVEIERRPIKRRASR